MKRFVNGLFGALLAVLLLGGIVIAASDHTPQGGSATAATLGQTTDDQTDDSAEPEEAPVLPSLTPIEAFLAQVLPAVEADTLPSAQRVLLSRDPFRPVVPEESTDGGTDGTDGTDGGTDGTDGGTDGTDGGDTDGTDGTDGGTDGTDGETNGDACTGDENETVCEGLVVTLDGFTDDGEAVITVDGVRHVVQEGDVFATSFEVLAINPPCATLLFGDEAFSICTGATVLK